MTVYYLKEDINSSNRKNYAKKGEKIILISDHDNCAVVESIETKKRFGINKNRFTIEFIEKEIIKPEIKNSKK